ncbi:MAG TPA: PepSY-associated TM helix domain-containing protein, partial [Bordetella sp.]
GLMFGASGILQNHRSVLKIDTPPPVVVNVRVQVPASVPQTPAGVSTWLQQELGLPKPFERVIRTPSQSVTWGDRTVQQPERWQLLFRTTREIIQAEYWPDARLVSARRSIPGWLGVIENLHRANGIGAAWVLLSDSIAGCLILLSLTGLLLWTELERKKLVGTVVFVASVATTLVVTVSWP